MKTRIELTDSTQSAFIKMSEGNPGALTALIALYKDGPQIDPQSAFAEISAMLSLDTLGIYGTDIYILWSDICERNSAKTLAVLRACQLGLFSGRVLADAAHRQDRSGKTMVPVDELYEKVKEQLAEFDRQPK